MSSSKRKLLGSSDLKRLYEITNPKLSPKPKLLLVVRELDKEWSIESNHSLRGYRGCQTNLAARVRQYESRNMWPGHVELGIGIFENEQLVDVLKAVDLGYKPDDTPKSTLPLDDMLGAMGLTRNDIQRPK
ncbi:hypothetical protein R50073_50910 (plasmid) [Maricurvus nonylphenolicus]|uniref:hypothetical protein n=1 Tax=Maricurvus nonylphenolicus TaxID=1008307 RepID=UPI0036F2EFB9